MTNSTNVHITTAARREGTAMGTTRKKTKFLVAALAAVGLAGGAVAYALPDPVNPQVNATGQDLTVGATPVPTFPSVAPTCKVACTIALDAGTGLVDVKDSGGTDHVPIYGFNVKGLESGAHVLAGDPASIIKVPVGTKVTINFSQTGIADPIDLSFPSLAPGDVSHVGNIYTVTPSAVGTSVFQPGTNAGAPMQIAMGLVGVLVVTPKGCTDTVSLKCAYGTTQFQDEAVVATTDIDPDFAKHPAHYDMSYFGQARDSKGAPRTVYHLINGASYPDTAPIFAMPSDKVLLRYVNAGVSDKSMGLLGLHQDLLGRNASAYTDPQTLVAPLIGPGETADVSVSIPMAADVAAGQEYALMDQSKQLGRGNGMGFGGALTFLSIWKGDRPAPVAAITSPFDGTTLIGTGTPTAVEAQINGYRVAVSQSNTAPLDNDAAWKPTTVTPAAGQLAINTPVVTKPLDFIWLEVTDTNGKTSAAVSAQVPPAPTPTVPPTDPTVPPTVTPAPASLSAPTVTITGYAAGTLSATATADPTLTITGHKVIVVPSGGAAPTQLDFDNIATWTGDSTALGGGTITDSVSANPTDTIYVEVQDSTTPTGATSAISIGYPV
ncbi:MAG: hypothetical protein WCI22_02435 [Actinomycetota bacterium]